MAITRTGCRGINPLEFHLNEQSPIPSIARGGAIVLLHRFPILYVFGRYFDVRKEDEQLPQPLQGKYMLVRKGKPKKRKGKPKKRKGKLKKQI